MSIVEFLLVALLLVVVLFAGMMLWLFCLMR
jgi:hypothetical protein